MQVNDEDPRWAGKSGGDGLVMMCGVGARCVWRDGLVISD